MVVSAVAKLAIWPAAAIVSFFTFVRLMGTLSPRKPVPKRTLAMFLGTLANSKDTVVQEKGSNPQNYF